MAKRFLFFPMFFPKTLQRLLDVMNEKPLIFDVDGSEIPVCSDKTLHKIRGKKCAWCGLSLDEISIQGQGKDNSKMHSTSSESPSFDFDSPTTSTVNPPSRIKEEKEHIVGFIEVPKPESMDLNDAKAYCVKCKVKVSIRDPQYSLEESARGLRRYMKGSCSICGTKICAIVKQE